MKPPRDAISALLEGRHDDPFSLLGVFPGPEGTFARTWIPGATQASAFSLAGDLLGDLALTEEGLFEGKVAGDPQPVRYPQNMGVA